MFLLEKFAGKINYFLFWIVIGIISYIVYYKQLNIMPMFTHSWAQSDRYSLSLNFLWNNFDFFHPATHNLNSIDGITGVEFPIHNYAIAILMSLFGTEAPWVQRLYVLGYSCLGLFALFQVSLLYNRSIFKSFFIILCIYFCPIFLFYQNNFLFNHIGFANTAIAMYFFHRYTFDKQIKNIWISIFFFTLATLTKTSFGLYFLTYFIYFNYRWFDVNNRKWQITFLIYCIGFSLILGYYKFNNYLNYKYNSIMFLNASQMFYDVWQAIYETGPIFSQRIFNIMPYSLIIFLFMGIVMVGIRTGIVLNRNKFVFLTILFVGLMSFYYLMGNQFKVHDYYFIELLYIPFFYLLLLMMNKLEVLYNKFIINFCLAIILLMVMYQGNDSYKKILTLNMEDQSSYISLDFADQDLNMNELGINKKEKVTILDSYSPNQILVYLHRKGKTIETIDDNTLQIMKDYGSKYFVLQNRKIDKFRDALELNKSKLSCIHDNGRYLVYKIN